MGKLILLVYLVTSNMTPSAGHTHTKTLHAPFCGISVNAKLFKYNQKHLLKIPDD